LGENTTQSPTGGARLFPKERRAHKTSKKKKHRSTIDLRSHEKEREGRR